MMRRVHSVLDFLVGRADEDAQTLTSLAVQPPPAE
jgi:hypothetical protein